METQLPDFVSDGQPSAPDVQPQAEAPAPAEAPQPEAPASEAPAPEGQPRGPDGKFLPAAPAEPAPAEPAAAAPVEPAPAPQPAPAADPLAPVAALLAERDKRQAAEQEARELREWRQQMEQRMRQQPQTQAPDPETDPAAYRAFQAQQLEGVFWDQRLEMSRQFAEIKHGAETVDQAFQWGVQRCDSDPHFNAQVRSQKDPVGFVVAQWQREQQLAALQSPDWEAFQAWKAAQTAPSAATTPAPAPQAPPAAAPAAPPAPAAPRPSLAAAPSANVTADPAVIDGAEAYRRMFGT